MPDDKRRHLRLPVESTVFIELVSPRMGSGDRSQVARCRTLDVSRGGLRVSLEYELKVGAILQVGVELPEVEDTLYLAGEVKWCQRVEGSLNEWCAGFELINADQTDIDRWLSLLVEMDG